VVSDEPDKYGGAGFPTERHLPPRSARRVQRDLREISGCTILIYDQTCAAEKRRRRKRANIRPAKRVFINEAVCEGCGDCSTQSNCLSVVPVETELGRKRAIDQSRATRTIPASTASARASSPCMAAACANRKRDKAPPGVSPICPSRSGRARRAYGILVTGVGGTGVVTIGALLGMAAHLEGKGVAVLDMTGLAQKGGAVFSHSASPAGPRPSTPCASRQATPISLIGLRHRRGGEPGRSRQSCARQERGDRQRARDDHRRLHAQSDFLFPAGDLRNLVVEATGAESAEFIDATRIATALSAIRSPPTSSCSASPIRRGWCGSGAAIDRAIELNGVASPQPRGLPVGAAWRRIAAPRSKPRRRRARRSRRDAVDDARRGGGAPHRRPDALPNAAYGARYERLVRDVETAERAKGRGQDGLADAVARSLFKLMAYKDEYEGGAALYRRRVQAAAQRPV